MCKFLPGSKFFFKDLYFGILSRLKLLQKYKFNIYVRNKVDLFNKYPALLNNAKVVSNLINFIEPRVYTPYKPAVSVMVKGESYISAIF
jgi:hypothetical protein